MSKFNLFERIIEMSQANSWDTAKLEWSLYEIYEAEEPEACLCGHYPIIELCVLKNRINNRYATVGNVCVKKFLMLESDRIFQAVKRVRKDNARALNAEAIEYGFSKGWINEWERKFCLDTIRKRKLSPKQKAKRIQINLKFSNNLRRSKSGA